MKIVLGLGKLEPAVAAIDLVAHLAFEAPHVDLVHVVETFGEIEWADAVPEPAELSIRHAKAQELEGRKLLDQGMALLRERGLSGEKVLLTGFAANQLMEYADRTAADLIVVRSAASGALKGLLAGGTARKLVTSVRQCLLIVKSLPVQGWSTTAVLATDHSDYMQDCLVRLAALAPLGIRRLRVVTAFPTALVPALRSTLGAFSDEAEQWIRRRLEAANARTVEQLAALGLEEIQAVVEMCSPSEAIRRQMRATGADLAIIGAHGHGVAERQALGSTAFQSAVLEPYSTLVLRA